MKLFENATIPNATNSGLLSPLTAPIKQPSPPSQEGK